MESEWETISKGLGKWRKESDYSHFMFMMAQNVSGFSVHSEKFPHKGYFEMPLFTFEQYHRADGYQVVCFNDTDGVHIDLTEKYLSSKYPNKSSFEI